MNITLIHNASAGDENVGPDKLVRMIREAGHNVVYRSADLDFEAAMRDGTELVAVAGGDGTVQKVAVSLLNKDIPLAILPTGTANNIAASMGIGGRIEDLVSGWADARRKTLSSGLASSPWETSVFIEAVGCGLFARAMSLLDSIDRSAPGDLSTTYDKLYRDICVLLALTAEARPREVEAVIDGQTISGDYLLIEAMNVCLIGPQLRLTDCDSDSDDRAGLDFVFLAAEHREQFLNYLIDSLAGRQTTAPVEVIRGQRMGMLWQGEPIHLDGRIWLDGKIRAGGTAGPPASQMIEMAIGESRLEILT